MSQLPLAVNLTSQPGPAPPAPPPCPLQPLPPLLPPLSPTWHHRWRERKNENEGGRGKIGEEEGRGEIEDTHLSSSIWSSSAAVASATGEGTLSRAGLASATKQVITNNTIHVDQRPLTIFF